MREIELTFQKNIRDLGGLVGFNGMKVKNGLIYRGGFLDKISEEDAEVLRSLNLTDVVDFRSEAEFTRRPDFRLENVRYHNHPPLEDHANNEDKHLADSNLLWFVSADATGFEHMERMYRGMVTSLQGKTAFRNFFKLLLDDEDRVIYFHCSQGKDRAGLAAFYLEIALGVDLEEAITDYLRSNKAMKVRLEYLLDIVQDRDYYNERYKQSMIDVFSAKIEYIYASIEEMIKMHGSVLNYIEKELNVDIDLLRKKYLE